MNVFQLGIFEYFFLGLFGRYRSYGIRDLGDDAVTIQCRFERDVGRDIKLIGNFEHLRRLGRIAINAITYSCQNGFLHQGGGGLIQGVFIS